MTDAKNDTPFRKIPSLDSLLREGPVRALLGEFGREGVVAAGRAVLDETRAAIASAEPAAAAPADVSPGALAGLVRSRLAGKFAPSSTH